MNDSDVKNIEDEQFLDSIKEAIKGTEFSFYTFSYYSLFEYKVDGKEEKEKFLLELENKFVNRKDFLKSVNREIEELTMIVKHEGNWDEFYFSKMDKLHQLLINKFGRKHRIKRILEDEGI